MGVIIGPTFVLLQLRFGVLETQDCRYPVNESDNQCCADQDDQIGSKEGHDKYNGVVKPIGADEHSDAEIQIEAAHADKADLTDPPPFIAVHRKPVYHMRVKVAGLVSDIFIMNPTYE